MTPIRDRSPRLPLPRARSAPAVIALAAFALALSSPAAVLAQTAYPMLMSLEPVSAQVGQTSEHLLRARYSLEGTYQVLVSGEGVTGEALPPESEEELKKAGKKKQPDTLKLRFTVAPDAKPGVREFRVATPRGVSTVGQLVIARDPVVAENDKNNSAAEAQPIELPATVCGVIGSAEDIDTFRFKIEKEQSLSFHVRGMRLLDRIHDLQEHLDPILTLRNAQGGTLATADNEFAADPYLAYHFTQPGEYLIEIRDVRYKGNQHWVYSLEINDRPFAVASFPLAVTRGQEQKLQVVGALTPADPTAALTVPGDVPFGLRPFPLALPTGPTDPVSVVVTDLPIVIETPGDNNAVGAAMPVSVPSAINGRIESEADVDCYAFEAKKGDRITLDVVARRAQSSLDSLVRILNAEGKQLAENDDLGMSTSSYADSRIENWTAPADGRYVIEIRDLLLRGGADFVYCLQLIRAEPLFELYLDTDKTQVPAGTSGVFFVNVTRKNGFNGEVQLQIDGLPPGVTAHCGRIPAGARDGCIILTAAAEAAPAVGNVKITYLPGGGRGHWFVESHAVCVGAPSDIRAVKLSTYELSLKPGQSQRIDVTIERAPEFKQNVTLDAIFRHLGGVYGNTLPAGVTIDVKNSKTLLTGEETKGHITLVAAKNAAPVDRQQVSVMANISLNFVMKATYSSDPLWVATVKP